MFKNLPWKTILIAAAVVIGLKFLKPTVAKYSPAVAEYL